MNVRLAVKRLLDVVVASVLLLLTAPAQFVITILVRRDLGRPVLFRQARPGRGGRVFTLLKFRTMRMGPQDPSNSDPSAYSDAERLTPLGRRLRSTSLDELPSLVNVLRGDMSLVGPRPLLVEYLDHYTSDQARRHDVRPGITGLAQTSGRNELEWDRRFELDLEYVENWSLRLDFLILLRTVKKVLAREGISASGEATMSKFTGNGEPVG